MLVVWEGVAVLLGSPPERCHCLLCPSPALAQPEQFYGRFECTVPLVLVIASQCPFSLPCPAPPLLPTLPCPALQEEPYKVITGLTLREMHALTEDIKNFRVGSCGGWVGAVGGWVLWVGG
jgi:hypothetical protein